MNGYEYRLSYYPQLKIRFPAPVQASVLTTFDKWMKDAYHLPTMRTDPYRVFREDDVAQPSPPSVKSDSDGMACRKCKEFYQFAEANEEGGTLLCYSCRQTH